MGDQAVQFVNKATGTQELYDSVVKGQGNLGDALKDSYPGAGVFNSISQNQPGLTKPDAPGDVPTPGNSQDALNAAAKKQRQPRGSAATTFSNQGGLMSGGAQAQRMMLGA